METTIGLNTVLYTFKTHQEMCAAIARMRTQGKITIVYLNNEYGFEFKPYHFITF